MKLCEKCQGKGLFNNDTCNSCDGEGINSQVTFVVGKQSRRQPTEFDLYKKDQGRKFNKIDKKNGVV